MIEQKRELQIEVTSLKHNLVDFAINLIALNVISIYFTISR